MRTFLHVAVAITVATTLWSPSRAAELTSVSVIGQRTASCVGSVHGCCPSSSLPKADAAGSNCLPQVATLGTINAVKEEVGKELKRLGVRIDALHGNTQAEINRLYGKLGEATTGLRQIAARDAAWAAKRSDDAVNKLQAGNVATQQLVNRQIRLVRGEHEMLAAKVEKGLGALEKSSDEAMKKLKADNLASQELINKFTERKLQLLRGQDEMLTGKVNEGFEALKKVGVKFGTLGGHLGQIEKTLRSVVSEQQIRRRAVREVEQGFGALRKEVAGIAKTVEAVQARQNKLLPTVATVTSGPPQALLEGEEGEEEEGQEEEEEEEGGEEGDDEEEDTRESDNE